MRTQVLAAVVAGGALLGGCYRMAAPEDREAARNGQLTHATHQESLDVSGPRVDPRTRTGAEDSAGSVPDLAEGQAPVSAEPERDHSPEQE